MTITMTDSAPPSSSSTLGSSRPPPPPPPPLLLRSLHQPSLPPQSLPPPPPSIPAHQKSSTIDQSITILKLNPLSSLNLRSMIERETPLSNARLEFALPKAIVETVLQRGPCCGIVALHMALAQMRWRNEGGVANIVSDIPSVEEMLEAARTKRFTSFGEMFSCENMAILARSYLPTADIRVQNVRQESNVDNDDAILRHFRDGGVVLAPYDKDADFRPCFKRGGSAHWALLLGMVAVTYGDEAVMEEEEVVEKEVRKKNVEVAGEQKLCARRLFVLAAHGKSKRIALWNWADLKKSNEQLKDYDWDKLKRENFSHDLEPVVPVGGVGEGLGGKMVFVS